MICCGGFAYVNETGPECRLSVNQWFPQLKTSLHPGELATCLLLFGLIDAMRLAFGAVANNKTPASYSQTILSLSVAAPGGAYFRPVAALACRPRPRTGAPSQTSAWATGSQCNPAIMNVPHGSSEPDPWVSSTSCSHWSLAHCDKVCTASGGLSTDNPPFWSGLLSPTTQLFAKIKDSA